MAEVTGFNPSTGITEFKDVSQAIADYKKQSQLKAISQQIANYQKQSISKGREQKVLYNVKNKIKSQKNKLNTKPISFSVFSKITGVGQPRKNLTIEDRLKILRFKNKLEKDKLKNALQKFKIQRQIELARKSGKLGMAQQVMQQPVRPAVLYPAYSTPIEQQDIDSAFMADINHGEGQSLWGNETYHAEGYFLQDDLFLNEFDGDPLLHLAIKYRDGVSPLLW